MTDAAWAWVAGVYEGEGSCDVLSVSGHHYARLRVKMTDRDVLEKLHGIVGGRGSLCGPHRPRLAHYKPTYDWTVSNAGDVALVVSMMWPWLCERRRGQIQAVLDRVGELNVGVVRRPAVHDPVTGRFAPSR